MFQNTLNLPSQKLFIVFIPIIIVLGLFSLFSSDKKPMEETVKDAVKVVSVTNNFINTSDSDGDTVPDWEEIIWKTDPKKENSFGKPDREYINDQIALSKSATSTASGAIMGSEDLTKQLFNRYVELQASGELNETTISSMTQDIASNIKINAIDKPYKLSDLTTFPDENRTQLEAYAQKFTTARAEFERITTIATTGKNLTPGDPSFSANMTSLAKLYEDFAKDIVSIPTPKGLAETTLLYLNAMKASAQSMKQIGNLNTDPLQSLLGLKSLTLAETAQDESVATIMSFLGQNGILMSNTSSQ